MNNGLCQAYCVAQRLDRGLILASDIRASAGADSFSKTRKMFGSNVPRERLRASMAADNRAMTKALTIHIVERVKSVSERDQSFKSRG